MPGQTKSADRRAARLAQYALQLREKQKVKRLYGLLEKTIQQLNERSSRRSGPIRRSILQFLNNEPITLFIVPALRPAEEQPDNSLLMVIFC